MVAGRLDGSAIAARIMAGGGKATLKTVQGESFTARINGSAIVMVDSKGGSANVTTANVRQQAEAWGRKATPTIPAMPKC